MLPVRKITAVLSCAVLLCGCGSSSDENVLPTAGTSSSVVSASSAEVSSVKETEISSVTSASSETSAAETSSAAETTSAKKKTSASTKKTTTASMTSKTSKTAQTSVQTQAPAVTEPPAQKQTGQQTVTEETSASQKGTPAPEKILSENDLDNFFSKSVFIGTSVGIGLKNYVAYAGLSSFGKQLMLSQNCYGLFYDEGQQGSQFQLYYNGVAAPAREIIRMTGAKYAFINVGTNDMFGNSDYMAQLYINYIQGIRNVNPDVVIYIEATTPVYKGGEIGFLNNATIDGMNARLAGYCAGQPDMYFIDINTPLKGPDGAIDPQYSSDRYVHLTYPAYQIWTDKVTAAVSHQLELEKKAAAAVLGYEKGRSRDALNAAEKALAALEPSALKDSLTARLEKAASA